MTRPSAIGTRKSLLLVRRSRHVQRPAAEARVGGDDQAERAPDAADLLDRDRVGQRVEAGAAFVLGERDAEPAQGAEPVDDRAREASRLLVLVDLPRDLAEHEVADRLAEEGVLRGEVEVHGRRVHRAGRPAGRAGSTPARVRAALATLC